MLAFVITAIARRPLTPPVESAAFFPFSASVTDQGAATFVKSSSEMAAQGHFRGR
jgi:hypothetical protein